MIIETGSQNASRLAGVYAYPSYRYSNQAISAVDRISGNADANTAREIGQSAAKSSQPIKMQDLETRLNTPANSYEGRAYGNKPFATGLTINLMA